MNCTFAFVRFSCLEEALRAVNQGNGRLMDGFSIKVFLEKRLSTQAWKTKVNVRREVDQNGTSKTLRLRKEGWSFKDALLSGDHSKGLVTGKTKSADALRFEEEEQIPIFWDLKESLLKSWFTDIDTVDNFMNKKKLRVWVRIEGMPLMAWQESVFNTIGSRWGNVIRIEEETVKRLRFDGARILLGVSCLSDVPPTAAISFEGEIFWLRISIAEFDDERCWIDQEQPNSPVGKLTRETTKAADCNVLGNRKSTGEDSLIEVPIDADLGSFDSSKQSLSAEPTFDPSSGLYSIRPKSLRYLSCLNSLPSGLCLVNNKVGLNNKLGKSGSHPGHVRDKRGLVGPRRSLKGRIEKRAAVKKLLSSSHAKFLFIQESKKQNVDAMLVRQLCGNNSKFNFIASPSLEMAGGIISLWDSDFFVCKDSRISSNFVVICGKISGSNFECALVNVYASNDDSDRICLFSELIGVVSNIKLPIIMSGDFNTVVSKEENVGVSLCRKVMLSFSEFIDDLGLVDLPLHGGKFTWSNFRERPSFSRLDRFLLSPDILREWPDLFQSLVPKSISDHNSIKLSMMVKGWGSRPFKWFNYLADEKDYVKELTSLCCYEKGAGIQSILRKCKSATKDWVSHKIGDVSSTIRNLESRCTEIEDAISRGVDDNELVAELKRCRSQLWDNLRREEREWLQKSRIKWAAAGDRNTKYFHAVASTRRRASYISNLNIDGVELCDPVEVKGAISKYFKRILMKGDTLPLKQFDCALNRVSALSAERLERPFSEE
ncbi:hypothetical protein V6N13_123701 [Hibiscus sabdariffa]